LHDGQATCRAGDGPATNRISGTGVEQPPQRTDTLAGSERAAARAVTVVGMAPSSAAKTRDCGVAGICSPTMPKPDYIR